MVWRTVSLCAALPLICAEFWPGRPNRISVEARLLRLLRREVLILTASAKV